MEQVPPCTLLHARRILARTRARTSAALAQVMSAPVRGFVNGLAIAPSGRYVAAAVAQEHRLGRWFRDASARNGVAIVPLPAAAHRK